MTRAIGDAHLRPYIIADPGFISVTIDESAVYLIVASDGLLDMITDEQLAQLVLELHQTYAGITTQEISDFLVRLALDLGSTDNVSCYIVDLRTRTQCKSDRAQSS
jgi:serine/threonine protein phosphatase PrpC